MNRPARKLLTQAQIHLDPCHPEPLLELVAVGSATAFFKTGK